MSKIQRILTFIVVLSVFGFVAVADDAPPYVKVILNFQKDGEPFNYPVDFNVKCYGTGIYEGNPLGKISEFSDTCQLYGCAFETYNIFSVGKRRMEYCNINGVANGEEFNVERFTEGNIYSWDCSFTNSEDYKWLGVFECQVFIELPEDVPDEPILAEQEEFTTLTEKYEIKDIFDYMIDFFKHSFLRLFGINY